MILPPPHASPPDRPDAVLDAAFQAFSTYGFRRTAMDDIARAAGLSRSALYLRFRNKEDVFRSLTQRLMDATLAEMEAALSVPGQSVEAGLLAAFAAKDAKFMALVLNTPHGAEIMDAGRSICSDIVCDGEAAMTRALAAWLAQWRCPPGLGSAAEVAGTIMAALKGLKATAQSPQDHAAAQARLAALMGRALR